MCVCVCARVCVCVHVLGEKKRYNNILSAVSPIIEDTILSHLADNILHRANEDYIGTKH